MDLAVKFGRMDVDAMLHELTAESYQEWLDYFHIRSGSYVAPQEPLEVFNQFKAAAIAHNARLANGWK